MGEFSAGQALGAGFRVIRRAPWAPLAWAVAALLLMAPELASYAWLGPRFLDLFQAASGHPPATLDTPQILGLDQQLLMLEPLVFLTSLVVHTLLIAAIYRAVLEPDARRWAYLRLGGQELWLGLVMLVLFVLLWIAMFAVILVVVVCGIIASIGARHAGAGFAAGLPVAALLIAGCAAVTWAALRLSMAMPMSFAQRRFLLFESWSLTRGHAWKLFGVLLAIFAIAWVFELVIVGLFWGGVLAASGLDLATLTTVKPAELVRRLVPIVLGFMPVFAVLGMGLLTIVVAPWAVIYRQLSRDEVAA